MANAVWPIYKTAMKAGSADVSLNINTAQDGPYVTLLAAGYTYNAAHDFFNDLTNAVGSPVRIANPTVGTVAAGVFDGDNVTFTALTGAVVTAFAIARQNAGANTTWRLVIYVDTGQTGLPVTPNGGDVTIAWHASGIFL